MFEMDGMVYYLDIKAINRYIFESQNKENTTTEVEEYIQDDEVLNKTVSKVRNIGNLGIDSIKHDFIKTMLDILSDPQWTRPDEGSVLQRITWNTMIKNGFLVCKEVAD